MEPRNFCSLCPLSREGWCFPRASSGARKMPQCLTSESEDGSEESEESSSSTDDLEELKEFVTLAFVRENTQKRLQNAQQHGKRKRKRKRLVSENEEAGWGRGEGEMGTGSVLKRTGRTGGKRALAAERRRRPHGLGLSRSHCFQLT